jgi:hypothetical protein
MTVPLSSIKRADEDVLTRIQYSVSNTKMAVLEYQTFLRAIRRQTVRNALVTLFLNQRIW